MSQLVQPIDQKCDDIETIPRVNKKLMAKHIGQIVVIVGKFKKQENFNKYLFLSPENEILQVYVTKDTNYRIGKDDYQEFQGKVLDENSIEVYKIQNWGNKFALSTWNRFIETAYEFPNLF